MNMSLSPIILFVYNRPDETQKALAALRQNILAPDSDLFIFSDAPKNPDVGQKVQQVRKIVHSIEGFKSVHIIEAEKNKGLAHSVIDGVSQIIEKYGKVIVLEDDLITSPNFLSFMNQALDFYENNQQIISITGCTYRLRIPKNYEYDVFFTHRMGSHGWATWLNCWQNIDWKVSDYDSFKYNIRQNLALMKGGNDLPRMLAACMKGKINSWAVRFCYHQYKTQTYTVWPAQSKVQNIGCNAAASNMKREKPLDRIDFTPSSEIKFCFTSQIFIDKTINRRFLLKFRIVVRIITNFLIR
ncbi:glycosyl transferase [Bacteroidia bacterium]|nr:glycosyl transferase [Bacteroidia bacterium]